jgi:hypothetical protein
MSTSPAGVITGAGVYWDAAGVTDNTCNLAFAGNTVDIGVSDVYPATCPAGYTLATGVQDFHGPVQTMTLAVPVQSTQTSISVEAAYMVFGFAADTPAHTVSPWTDPSAYQVRDDTSGTQLMISKALAQVGSGFSPSKVGSAASVKNASSALVLQNLTTSVTNAEQSIGFLATDLVDTNRGSVKALAFQFIGQSCGYLPDSATNTYDKQNVRDGHYAIWGPLHLLTPAGSDGMTAANANAATIISYLTGAAEPPFDLISVEARGGVVPDCAMRVSRTEDVGAMASYMPKHSCECAFLNAIGTTTCTPCSPDAAGSNASKDCPASAPACNYKFCEVQ